MLMGYRQCVLLLFLQILEDLHAPYKVGKPLNCVMNKVLLKLPSQRSLLTLPSRAHTLLLVSVSLQIHVNLLLVKATVLFL